MIQVRAHVFLLFAMLFLAPNAFGLSCVHFLSQNEIKANTYRRLNFDDNLVLFTGGKKSRSEEVVESLNTTFGLISSLGFRFQQSTAIVISSEKKPATLLDTTNGKDFPLEGPEAYQLSLLDTVQYVTYKNVLGFTKKVELGKDVDLLHIPETYLDAPFTIAHEVAHLSETPNTRSSAIWREARADFLAFAVTNSTELRTYGTPILNRAQRDMSDPLVRHLADLYLSRDKYHKNSELISSILYDVSKVAGLEVALNFVREMDNPSKMSSVLNPLEFRSMREDQAVLREVEQLVQALRAWADGLQSESPELSQAVQSILSSRDL